MAENGNIIKIDDDEFDDFIEDHENVIVDFWASWCAPCKMLDPVIEELSEKYEDDVQFGKVNTEQNQQIPSRFGVQAIPTLIFLKNGEVVDQLRGAVPKSEIEEKISKNF